MYALHLDRRLYSNVERLLARYPPIAASSAYDSHIDSNDFADAKAAPPKSIPSAAVSSKASFVHDSVAAASERAADSKTLPATSSQNAANTDFKANSSEQPQFADPRPFDLYRNHTSAGYLYNYGPSNYARSGTADSKAGSAAARDRSKAAPANLAVAAPSSAAAANAPSPAAVEPEGDTDARDWNEHYQSLFETPVQTPSDGAERHKTIGRLVEDFVHTAAPIAETIVKELALPGRSLLSAHLNSLTSRCLSNI